MIDYGLAKKFIDPFTNHHIKYSEDARFVGTCRYASLNAHNHIELSRRDDLFSWFYTLVELAVGKLPWKGKADLEGTIRGKNEIPIEILCENMPHCFQDIFLLISKIEFEEEPNYQRIIDMLQAALDELGEADRDFDWEYFEDEVQNISFIPLQKEESDDQIIQDSEVGCHICIIS